MQLEAKSHTSETSYYIFPISVTKMICDLIRLSLIRSRVNGTDPSDMSKRNDKKLWMEGDRTLIFKKF